MGSWILGKQCYFHSQITKILKKLCWKNWSVVIERFTRFKLLYHCTLHTQTLEWRNERYSSWNQEKSLSLGIKITQFNSWIIKGFLLNIRSLEYFHCHRKCYSFEITWLGITCTNVIMGKYCSLLSKWTRICSFLKYCMGWIYWMPHLL